MSLEISEIESDKIFIVEDNLSKKKNSHFGLFSHDTFKKVEKAFEEGKDNEIPPIVVMKRNFTFQYFKELYFLLIKEGILKFDFEKVFNKDIIEKLIEQYEYIVYEGNSRLEIFQKHNKKIKAYIMKQDSDFQKVPEEEQNSRVLAARVNRVKKSIDDFKKLNQNFTLFDIWYFIFFHDGVQIVCEKEHQENVLKKFKPFRKKK